MNKTDFINGRIGKSILLFLIPILVGSLIQQLYSTVDLICVGNFSGKEATAAIGAGGLIITCLIGFFSGIAVGTNVVAAHIYGEKDLDQFKRVIQTVFVTGIIGGFILMITGIYYTPIFLGWMNTPEDIFNLAVIYLRIYMLSIIPIILYNLCAGILRAIGNSRTPMMLQLVGGIVNIVIDIILIGIMGKGVIGAAIATVVSQSFVAVMLLRHLYYQKSEQSLKFTFKIFDFELLKRILRIGIPSGIQAIVITLSNIIIQTRINGFGVDAIAAFAAYFKIEMLIYIPIISLGQALVSFVGQNFGARQYDRIKTGTKYAIYIGSVSVILLSSILLFNIAHILYFFTDDVAVISYGIQIVRITFPFYFLYVILECLGAESRGKGKAIIPMGVSIISFCGIRIITLIFILRIWHDIRGVASTYPISWTVAVCLMVICRCVQKSGEEVEDGY